MSNRGGRLAFFHLIRVGVLGLTATAALLWISSYFIGFERYRSDWTVRDGTTMERATWLVSNYGSFGVAWRVQEGDLGGPLPASEQEFVLFDASPGRSANVHPEGAPAWHWLHHSPTKSLTMGSMQTGYGHLYVPYWVPFLGGCSSLFLLGLRAGRRRVGGGGSAPTAELDPHCRPPSEGGARCSKPSVRARELLARRPSVFIGCLLVCLLLPALRAPGDEEESWSGNRLTKEQPFPAKVTGVAASWVGYHLLLEEVGGEGRLCVVQVWETAPLTYRLLKSGEEAEKLRSAGGWTFLAPGIEVDRFSWSIGAWKLGKIFGDEDLLSRVVGQRRALRAGQEEAEQSEVATPGLGRRPGRKPVDRIRARSRDKRA